MLKFIGQFEELEMYGFERVAMYPPEVIGYEKWVSDDICLSISRLSKEYKNNVDYDDYYEVSIYTDKNCYYDIPVVLFDLIKDGLIIKEEE